MFIPSINILSIDNVWFKFSLTWSFVLPNLLMDSWCVWLKSSSCSKTMGCRQVLSTGPINFCVLLINNSAYGGLSQYSKSKNISNFIFSLILAPIITTWKLLLSQIFSPFPYIYILQLLRSKLLCKLLVFVKIFKKGHYFLMKSN